MLGINYESSDDEQATPVDQTQETVLKDQHTTVERPPKPAASSPVTLDNVSPGSPYTSTRSLLRNLSLPTVPNFNIPSSPLGSPPQKATQKFAKFLELKKKGQHFNHRLESSPVLRDPGHLQKLMHFAGISEEEQHAPTLPDGLAVPATFPEWAYAEELSASQKKITRAKEEASLKKPRGAIDFVPATRSGASSGISTPASAGVNQSVADRTTSMDTQSLHKRKELEHRGGRSDSSSQRNWRSRSRSPKRRRSRSRDRR